MILYFKIRNFLSIREEQILSFEASADETLRAHYVVDKGKTTVLKMGIIFGANASGKTNVLNALDFVKEFIERKPASKEVPTGHIPFMLDDVSASQPGFFELAFFIEDTLYKYQLELNGMQVFRERLVYYPGSQPATLFDRRHNPDTDTSMVALGNKIRNRGAKLKLLQANTLKNMSVLAAYASLNMDFPELAQVYHYLSKDIYPVIHPKSNLLQWTSKRIEASEDAKTFLIRLLNNADIHISDIQLKEIMEEEDQDVPTSGSNSAVADQMSTYTASTRPRRKVVGFKHSTLPGYDIIFPSSLESAGTRRLYELGGVLYEALRFNRCLMIDELESSMHPDLVIHFLNMFLVNATEAQLICTTHDLNILSEQDNLRKDIVWFTQKGRHEATELYSLADFSYRKELSYLKAYKAGKFGAKPKLGSIQIEH